jgi:DNA ligase (NAD+)
LKSPARRRPSSEHAVPDDAAAIDAVSRSIYEERDVSEANPFKKSPDTDFQDVGELSEEEATEQVEQLREALDYHDHRYYVESDPAISDRAYDELFRRLEELEEEFPELRSENSPTRRVGGEPVDELPDVEHLAPMLSLEAATDEEEIVDFDATVREELPDEPISYLVEPKFDGLSVEVVYRDGAFERAVTRGDGRVGDDISRNARTIRSLPLRLREDGDGAPGLLSVRGEIFIAKSSFQELNRRRIEEDEEPFANPRNAAAGTVRRLDPDVVARRPLEIFFFEILEVSDRSFESGWEALEHLPDWGLRTAGRSRRIEGLDEMRAFYEDLREERDELDYEIDGVVIKVDRLEHRRELGVRSRDPRWAIAWKFPPRQEVTTLEDITVQVGRTGKITPIALLAPVDIGGVTVSRANLHNIEQIEELDVRIGDEVRVRRAGDVIPEVAERISRSEDGATFEMPESCPACGAELVREGPNHFCPNQMECPAQLERTLEHYGSREAMDIEGLGEETVAMLVERDLVAGPADLYELEVDDLVELERFARKKARNLLEAIDEARSVRLDRFLYALGVRHVGPHNARLLARRFGTLEALREASREELEQIDEIGPEIAASVVHFFDEQATRRELDELLAAGVEVEPMPSQSDEELPLEGQTFVFTGALGRYTREEAERRVEDLGARAASSVSGETDVLVRGEDPGSKLDDARQEGVEILDEEDFLELVDEG